MSSVRTTYVRFQRCVDPGTCDHFSSHAGNHAGRVGEQRIVAKTGIYRCGDIAFMQCERCGAQICEFHLRYHRQAHVPACRFCKRRSGSVEWDPTRQLFLAYCRSCHAYTAAA